MLVRSELENHCAEGYQHARRMATACQINPIPYYTDHFGHKLHIDQKQKLVMFGVYTSHTHTCMPSGWLQWDDGRDCYHACENNVEL